MLVDELAGLEALGQLLLDRLLDDARAGEADPLMVAQVLESLNFEAVTGQLTFDAAHNPIKAMVILQLRAGAVVYRDSVTP